MYISASGLRALFRNWTVAWNVRKPGKHLGSSAIYCTNEDFNQHLTKLT